MDRKRPGANWRVAAFAAALFAITLNFLQPLAHAALMRDGGPLSTGALWSAFCLPTADEHDAPAPVPVAGKLHECCLGLAQAPALATPPTAFALIEPVATAIRFTMEPDGLTPVGIRDGPSQPRGPPFPV